MLIDKFNNSNISIDVFLLKYGKLKTSVPMMDHRAYLPDENDSSNFDFNGEHSGLGF